MDTPTGQPHRDSPSSGFTLIELLVVVVILGILAALLLPVGKSMLARSWEAKCISNLRQTGGAIAAYTGDNNGELPINNSPDRGLRWYLMLNPYIGKSISSSNQGWAGPSIFICPANDPKSPGNTFKIWLDFGYACNLALMPRLDGGNYFPGPPVRMANIKERRALVADTGTNRSQFFKSSSNQTPYGGQVARGFIHRDGVNVLWTDFSVSWMKASEFIGPEGAAVTWY